MMSGSFSSATSRGEELLNSGFVELMVLCWEPVPIIFCSKVVLLSLCERRTRTIIRRIMMMMVRVAPIRMPSSGEIGRSPSEAETQQFLNF